MNLWLISLFVTALGAVGGLANCLLAGEFPMPHRDPGRNVWKPGWIANILVGAIAALVVWAIYGPASSFDLSQSTDHKVILPVAQLGGSIVVGIGGARILTALAQKEAKEAEKEAERTAKNELANTLQTITEAALRQKPKKKP